MSVGVIALPLGHFKNCFEFPLHPDDLRWAAAEGVSEDVIAAVLLLHERSVDEIAPELSVAELERVIKLVRRSPRVYPPGTLDALKQRRTSTSPQPPSDSGASDLAAKEPTGRTPSAKRPRCRDTRSSPDPGAGGHSPQSINGTSYDAAVSGADPIETRPGFAELLNRIEDNGVRIVIVEDASRFARELVTQELGILALIKRGMRVLTANGDDLTDSSDPSRKMMRQIAGSFHEYEKARLVAKLKVARDRKRAIGAKVEGRKSHAELNPEMVALVRQLRRKRPKGGRRSLREISRELADAGYLNEHGRPFAPNSIRNMLAEPRRARISDDGEEEAT